MKTVAVIGANGKSGKAFVAAALTAGYNVRAGVHSHNSLSKNDRLTIVRIDATNQTDVERLLDGADVVVSLIGHGPKSPKHVQTNSIKAIVAAAKTTNVQRVISLTGTGVRFPGDTPLLIDRFLNALLRYIVMPNVIKDGIAHANVLKDSNLEWTLLRGLILTQSSPGTFTLSEHGPAKLLCPRTEIAEAILQIIDDTSTHKKALIISHSS